MSGRKETSTNVARRIINALGGSGGEVTIADLNHALEEAGLSPLADVTIRALVSHEFVEQASVSDDTITVLPDSFHPAEPYTTVINTNQRTKPPVSDVKPGRTISYNRKTAPLASNDNN